MLPHVPAEHQAGASGAGTDQQAGTETAILRTLRHILRRVDQDSSDLEQRHGVNQSQLLCLRVLADTGRLMQRDLTHAVHLSASALVGVIDRLELKGLVTRTRDSEDRRRVFVAVTAAGRAKAQDAPEPLQQRVARALAALPAEELHCLTVTFDRLVTLLDAACVEDQGHRSARAVELAPTPLGGSG